MTEPLASNAHAIKLAQTDKPVLDIIKERWSARSFQPKPIAQEELDTIFEAASWAPSSMNEQPWMYLYAQHGTARFDELWNTLMQGNQPWAKNAGVLIASLTRTNHAGNGAHNRYAWYDTGSANQNLLLQAASMGILGHVMGGFNHQQAKELLQLPDGIDLVCIIALGYPDSAEALEEPFRSRELTPRRRQGLDTFVFEDNLK